MFHRHLNTTRGGGDQRHQSFGPPVETVPPQATFMSSESMTSGWRGRGDSSNSKDEFSIRRFIIPDSERRYGTRVAFRDDTVTSRTEPVYGLERNPVPSLITPADDIVRNIIRPELVTIPFRRDEGSRQLFDRQGLQEIIRVVRADYNKESVSSATPAFKAIIDTPLVDEFKEQELLGCSSFRRSSGDVGLPETLDQSSLPADYRYFFSRTGVGSSREPSHPVRSSTLPSSVASVPGISSHYRSIPQSSSTVLYREPSQSSLRLGAPPVNDLKQYHSTQSPNVYFKDTPLSVTLCRDEIPEVDHCGYSAVSISPAKKLRGIEEYHETEQSPIRSVGGTLSYCEDRSRFRSDLNDSPRYSSFEQKPANETKKIKEDYALHSARSSMATSRHEVTCGRRHSCCHTPHEDFCTHSSLRKPEETKAMEVKRSNDRPFAPLPTSSSKETKSRSKIRSHCEISKDDGYRKSSVDANKEKNKSRGNAVCNRGSVRPAISSLPKRQGSKTAPSHRGSRKDFNGKRMRIESGKHFHSPIRPSSRASMNSSSASKAIRDDETGFKYPHQTEQLLRSSRRSRATTRSLGKSKKPDKFQMDTPEHLHRSSHSPVRYLKSTAASTSVPDKRRDLRNPSVSKVLRNPRSHHDRIPSHTKNLPSLMSMSSDYCIPPKK